MIIQNLGEFDFNLGSGLKRSSARDTGKIHLTDIILYIDRKLSLSKHTKGGMKWNMHATQEVGFLWEEVLSHVLADRYAARIGEVECDGIVGSPDGLNTDPLDIVPLVNEEYKATWRSVNKTPESIWYWDTQFKSYCHMLGVNITLLRVLYINGDYKGSGPIPMTFRIEYTDTELQENWGMITNHRDEMLRKDILTIQEYEEVLQDVI